jgi:hypothetical protein
MTTVYVRAKCGAGLTLALLGCSSAPAAPPKPDSHFHLTASIRDLMEAEIDPSADFLWASVASVSSAAGFVDRQPRTDEEWAEVRRKALTLVEATNLLVMPGRRVSAVYVPSRAPGELDSTKAQERLDASREVFEGFAGFLREAGLVALKAIDAKSPDDLFEAGGTIDVACETCHLTYWYPDQESIYPSKR